MKFQEIITIFISNSYKMTVAVALDVKTARFRHTGEKVDVCQKYVCVCIPIRVTTFPEWLSGKEPLPHTPGPVCPSSLCL